MHKRRCRQRHMYARAAAVYAIFSIFLILSKADSASGSSKDGDNSKHGAQTMEGQWEKDSICDGDGALSGVNPVVDTKCASAYKVEIAEKDRIHKHVSPTCTEVVAEAKNRGLVPIAIFSIFSSPGNEDMSKTMPVNLNALVSSLFYNAAREDSNADNGGYVFLKGAVADAFESEADRKKKKDDSRDKGKEEESDDNEEGDENDKSGNTSGQKG